MKLVRPVQIRMFSADVVSTEAPAQENIELEPLNVRVGADEKFNKQKHAYLLDFPWYF